MSDPKLGSAIRLSRSRQTWTGAGSAAGFVLRYVAPMRRLLIDMTGSEAAADRALAILIQHLVKAGYGEHDRGRLRDFLIRGMRSAAKAQAVEQQEAEEQEAEQQEAEEQAESVADLRLDFATLESPTWIGYWREGMLQRAWRMLERHQHTHRFQLPRTAGNATGEESSESDESAKHDLVYDVLKTAMAHSGESAKVLSGRVAATVGRRVSETELRRQLDEARPLFAQFLADEVACSLQEPDPHAIREEIKKLGLAKAFTGLKVRA